MRRESVDTIADEIYRLQITDGSSLKDAQESCKRFYRRIAKWHLTKMEGEQCLRKSSCSRQQRTSTVPQNANA
jgi:hypothetical protein